MPAEPVRDAALDVLLRVFDERAIYLDVSLDKTQRRKKLSNECQHMVNAEAQQ